MNPSATDHIPFSPAANEPFADLPGVPRVTTSTLNGAKVTKTEVKPYLSRTIGPDGSVLSSTASWGSVRYEVTSNGNKPNASISTKSSCCWELANKISELAAWLWTWLVSLCCCCRTTSQIQQRALPMPPQAASLPTQHRLITPPEPIWRDAPTQDSKAFLEQCFHTGKRVELRSTGTSAVIDPNGETRITPSRLQYCEF